MTTKSHWTRSAPLSHLVLLTALIAALALLPACYTKTVSRTGGFGPRAGEVHEPDAPDNALEDAADVIYERDWKRRERSRDDD